MNLKIGQLAPDFKLLAIGNFITDHDSQKNNTPNPLRHITNLANYKGSNVIIFFYPQNNAPGCTQEISDFRDLQPDFHHHHCHIIGISPDEIFSHKQFIQNFNLNYQLLSDLNSTVAKKYGIKTCNDGFLERTTFLVDSFGMIRNIWRDVQVEKHAKEVLITLELMHLATPRGNIDKRKASTRKLFGTRKLSGTPFPGTKKLSGAPFPGARKLFGTRKLFGVNFSGAPKPSATPTLLRQKHH